MANQGAGWRFDIMRRVAILLFVIVSSLAIFGAYRLALSYAERDIIRERALEEIAAANRRYNEIRERYIALGESYNEAVKKTAVTELIAYEDGSVCVAFISLDGTEEIRKTPFKLGSEVYVDFAVMDGRAFFRRVFDENTPPKEALVINPIDKSWSKTGETTKGRAVYTRLEEPGRWTVTLSGNGSLDMAKKGLNEPPTPLMVPPTMKDYPVIETDAPVLDENVEAKLDDIGPGDVFKALFGSSRS